MLEIKESAASVDTRWTFFQAPFVVEDALGFKYPVPSEYNFEMLQNTIEFRFRKGLGSLEVQAGNYELFQTYYIRHVISSTSALVPGTRITMAVLICEGVTGEGKCPQCWSAQIVPLKCGRQAWCVSIPFMSVLFIC